MTDLCKHVLLIGGGHAHVAVLADWARGGLPCPKATLLTPHKTLRYSGTVPGWISGQYERDAGLVDLAALAAAAGVELKLDRCVGIDPQALIAKTADGGHVSFDIASIDTGGIGRAELLLGSDPRLLDVRPIDDFVRKLDGFGSVAHSAVVGGGAAGVELAFALRNRSGGTQVTLFAGESGVLPEQSSPVRRKVARELDRQNITCIDEDVQLHDDVLRPFDLIVAALGSGAPDWPGQSGLKTSEEGFIAVDRHQRSTSHPHIFAVGDVAMRTDREVAHSGVHAVMAGPVLADNLRAAISGLQPSKVYRPRWFSLYLLSTARGEAILSYGPLAAQGKWAARLKHWIDMRWIRHYAKTGRGL